MGFTLPEESTADSMTWRWTLSRRDDINSNQAA
jgi:hypothetical protein